MRFQVPLKVFVIEGLCHVKRPLLLLCDKDFVEISKDKALSQRTDYPRIYIMEVSRGKGQWRVPSEILQVSFNHN